MAAVDDNGNPVLYGVSHVDGKTPVQVKFSSTRRILLDMFTTIQFDPSVVAFQNENDRSLAKATSSSDDQTVLPWVVNARTGAVLVTFS